MPDHAGVIVRTAAEGASEEELRADVERLTKIWDKIKAKAESAGAKKAGSGGAPALLHGEPDLTVRVIRDVFNEDFTSLVVSGDKAWGEVSQYVEDVAPDLAPRLQRWTARGGRLRRAPHRRAARQGDGPQGVAAVGRLAGHRPHRGDDRRRRQHRQVRRLRGQPRGDRHQEQPRGRRGDRPPAPAARHRRHHRHRLHRHGAGVQPRPRGAPAARVPGPRPHQAPGRRGHLARPGADDPQAGRLRACSRSSPSTCEHCGGRGIVVHTEPIDRSGGTQRRAAASQRRRPAPGAAVVARPPARPQAGNGSNGSGGPTGARCRRHPAAVRPDRGPDRRRRARRGPAPRRGRRARHDRDDAGAGRGRRQSPTSVDARAAGARRRGERRPTAGVEPAAGARARRAGGVRARADRAGGRAEPTPSSRMAEPEPVAEPEPEPVADLRPVVDAEPEPEPAARRGRRKRGRVVAPAGPPRAHGIRRAASRWPHPDPDGR